MNWRNSILTGIVGFSGLLNVVLGPRVLSLERSLHPVPRIKSGTRLEDIVGADANGLPLTIRFADSRNPTVLLVLRPGCSWCAQNMPNWQALIREKGQSFRFIVVSLSAQDFKGYLEANKLAVPAVFPMFEKNPALGGVTATPQTIVVESNGVVGRVWLGAYTPEIKREIEAFFGMGLPIAVQPSG